MRYDETGFRSIYKQFCVFPMTGSIRLSMWDFPETKNADSLLCYGFVGDDGKLAAEILCAAFKDEETGEYRFAEGSDEQTAILPFEKIRDLSFTVLEDPDRILKQTFAAKLKALKKYDPSDEVEESRTFRFLDESRDEEKIDQVQVYLIKDGFEPEGCMVQITGVKNHSFQGILLEQPYQDFGRHAGENVEFYIRKTDEGSFLCYTDLTSDMNVTEAELADGSLLRSAIHIYKEARNELHLIHVLEYLRDSIVTVPCRLADSDSEAEPDILKGGDDLYFPVFTREEEAKGYGDSFTLVQMPFLKAITLAETNARSLKGIVVDAFTQPFVLNKAVYETVKNMRSRLE